MIYFDNAATTQIHQEVKEEMLKAMDLYGNPASTHIYGRKSRVFIEDRRRKIADLLGVKSSTIFFTSCGTESIQTALTGAVRDIGVDTIITSALEHHAVIYNISTLQKQYNIKVEYVKFNNKGKIDTDHLSELLDNKGKKMVVLMHANNETGMLLQLKKVANLCKEKQSLFLTDTVQTMGKYRFNSIKGIDFATASAHKFHGPKGVGFIYISPDISIQPLIVGGGQERKMRSGTENIIGISGMTKALEIAIDKIDENQEHIENLREKFLSGLIDLSSELKILTDIDHSLYTILNVGFPKKNRGSMLQQRLDIAGIAASGGSACTSGSESRSHVLEALEVDSNYNFIRFSFGCFNTFNEVDIALDIIDDLI